jgi:hypothetical protein
MTVQVEHARFMRHDGAVREAQFSMIVCCQPSGRSQYRLMFLWKKWVAIAQEMIRVWSLKGKCASDDNMGDGLQQYTLQYGGSAGPS